MQHHFYIEDKEQEKFPMKIQIEQHEINNVDENEIELIPLNTRQRNVS